MKSILIIGLILSVLFISGCDSGTSTYSSNSAKTSSGEMCTFMRTVTNNGAERTSGLGCPSGEQCVKATTDIDGDGLLCSKTIASDGVMYVCDGRCQ